MLKRNRPSPWPQDHYSGPDVPPEHNAHQPFVDGHLREGTIAISNLYNQYELKTASARTSLTKDSRFVRKLRVQSAQLTKTMANVVAFQTNPATQPANYFSLLDVVGAATHNFQVAAGFYETLDDVADAINAGIAATLGANKLRLLRCYRDGTVNAAGTYWCFSNQESVTPTAYVVYWNKPYACAPLHSPFAAMFGFDGADDSLTCAAYAGGNTITKAPYFEDFSYPKQVVLVLRENEGVPSNYLLQTPSCNTRSRAALISLSTGKYAPGETAQYDVRDGAWMAVGQEMGASTIVDLLDEFGNTILAGPAWSADVTVQVDQGFF